MRLIYNTKYSVIDKNIFECQMGARKDRGSKNNIFNERKLVLGLQHVKVTVKVKVKVKVQMEKFRNIGVLP